VLISFDLAALQLGERDRAFSYFLGPKNQFAPFRKERARNAGRRRSAVVHNQHWSLPPKMQKWKHKEWRLDP
jgi:hypothetical protein